MVLKSKRYIEKCRICLNSCILNNIGYCNLLKSYMCNIPSTYINSNECKTNTEKVIKEILIYQ